VKLDPRNYSNILNTSSFDLINNKWFINFSYVNIPQNIQRLLQLGQNYPLPFTNTKNNIIQLIKNIENNIIKLYQDTQNEIRNRSMPFIHNLMSKSLYKESTDIQIIDLIKITNKFIKNNPNIIFIRADKRNITVALEKTEYLNKIEEILNDTETYEKINKDPTKLTNKIREVLTVWKKKEYITDNIYTIYCSDGNLPRTYWVT